MFSKFFIERPRFAVVIAIIMSLAGIIAIFSLPVAMYPEITPPQVTVFADYTGASAETVANTVAVPIEKEINGTIINIESHIFPQWVFFYKSLKVISLCR